MIKDPNSRRYPSGLEWVLFKKLPLLTLLGFLGLGGLLVLARLWPWEGTPQEIAMTIQKFEFALIGAAIFHITMMVTVLIGCVVVMIMKGPRYSADSYPIKDRERPDFKHRPRH